MFKERRTVANDWVTCNFFLIASDRQREFIEVIYRCEEVSFNKHRKVKIMGKDRPVNFLMFE